MAMAASTNGGLVEMNWDPITRIVGSLASTPRSISASGRWRSVTALVRLPRVQHLHEGKGPARRALHHQPHLRDLRRQSLHLLLLRAADGLRGETAPSRRVDRQPGRGGRVHVRSQHLPGEPVAVDFCEKMVRETNPGVWEKAAGTEAPHAKDHGYKTIGDIMKSVNPIEGEFYARRSRSAATRARCSA